jgi:hypothetical protein
MQSISETNKQMEKNVMKTLFGADFKVSASTDESDSSILNQIPSTQVSVKKSVPTECQMSKETTTAVLTKARSTLYVCAKPSFYLFSHIITQFKTDELIELMTTLSTIFLELSPEMECVQCTGEAKYKITYHSPTFATPYTIILMIFANKKDKTNSCSLDIEFDKLAYSDGDKRVICRVWDYVKYKLANPSEYMEIPIFDTLCGYKSL